MELLGLSAREIAAGVKAKKFTAEEAARASIERIKRYDKKYNAIVALCEEEAVASAKRVDEAVARGEEPGALCGVPYVVKDNFCTKGIATTCCSKMLKGWVPNYDATAVEKMKEAGAVLIGKANMDEFAMGSTTESSIFGATLNPRDRTRVPGGSSGGSAAAVAAGYVPVALGSDTGGSVRQPAAFCGVQGMKPSYGQISRYGIVAYASSLDQVGPLAANVGDLALLMDVLAKGAPNDTTCDAYERPSFTGAAAKASLAGKRVALLTGYDRGSLDAPLSAAIDRAVEICRAEGASIIDVKLPITMEHSVACYYMVALGDASSKLACYDGMRYGHHADGRNLSEMYKKSRMEGFGEEVRKRILVGTCILTRGYYENYFVPATKVRQLISDEFKNLFEKADMLICPISPALAYKRGLGEKDPVRMYLGDVFTTIANLAGLPSVSLNLGFTAEGLPTNVQLLAPRFGDDGLLCCAAAIERAAGAPHIAELTEDD
ncbi:Asp-tRNA(Asn)/Glu-tRNA(Gln) amidotransferase subunit GatA [Synergistes jonesii]|uniref:Asp-tRNA(Asn)/Glu-tRNA(Gln) amidotransferase subunit GatA n=1 Tax=Synergistes jonesii TaxID=2754 RepID=UPI00248EC014|nr:Asp-tRNA(Asn)/Glu-tRNA(Gln) amidotransferase subunit GatA [Synergistes jonesii]